MALQSHSSLMALKVVGICKGAKTHNYKLGASDLAFKRPVSALHLRYNVDRCGRRECCHLRVMAQRAITPIEDDKPGIETSEGIDRTDDNCKRFRNNVNFLPRPLSATDAFPSHADGSKVRVAFQGLPGAYSEAAALKAYPGCETVPCHDFEAAFKAVERCSVEKAILPIENSIDGSIHHSYDLLLRHRLHIVGEVQLQVKHCLLGLPGVRKEELRRVFSHPQALAQCEVTLSNLGIVRISTEDAAGAAKMVASTGERQFGAIAGAQAAAIYGLDIVEEKIQDVDDNVTRFVILAKEPNIPGTHRPYKTSIVCTLEEGPDVLHKVLSVFALREINLIKLESLPRRQHRLRINGDSDGGNAKYFGCLFYIDFEASMVEPRAQNAMGQLQEYASFLCILGCYPMDAAA